MCENNGQNYPRTVQSSCQIFTPFLLCFGRIRPVLWNTISTLQIYCLFMKFPGWWVMKFFKKINEIAIFPIGDEYWIEQLVTDPKLWHGIKWLILVNISRIISQGQALSAPCETSHHPRLIFNRGMLRSII